MAKPRMSNKMVEFIEKERTNPHPCTNCNSKGEYIKTALALEDCLGKCETCGFNPAVQKDRLENGKWVKNLVSTVTFFDNDMHPIETKTFTGLYGIVIPKQRKTETAS